MIPQETDIHGTPATRQFYDTRGWKRENDQLVDQRMFGVREDGPIRKSLHRLATDRIRQALGGASLWLMECGCGGTPATFLADICRRFTAVDFSTTGLAEAAGTLRKTRIPFETVAADLCSLPFRDQQFDAAYCAQAIYHIDRPEGQAAAFDQILRVVRRGGTAVFVMVNPLPLLFPVRAGRRVLASTPVICDVLNRCRPKPPLPFNPMRIGWMRARLEEWGRVDVFGYRIASTWFNQCVSETAPLGRFLWRGCQKIETDYPAAAAHLGNYVTIVVQKR